MCSSGAPPTPTAGPRSSRVDGLELTDIHAETEALVDVSGHRGSLLLLSTLMLLFAALGGCGAGDDAPEVSIGASGISVSVPAVPDEEVLWGAVDLTNMGDEPIAVHSVRLLSPSGEPLGDNVSFLLIDGQAGIRPGVDIGRDEYSQHLHGLDALRLEVPGEAPTAASQAGLVVVFISDRPLTMEGAAVEIALSKVESGEVDRRRVDATARICFDWFDRRVDALPECELLSD